MHNELVWTLSLPDSKIPALLQPLKCFKHGFALVFNKWKEN